MEKKLSNNPSYIAKEHFYEFCSQDLNYTPRVKLFFKLDLKNKFTSEVLTAGLIGST